MRHILIKFLLFIFLEFDYEDGTFFFNEICPFQLLGSRSVSTIPFGQFALSDSEKELRL